MVAERYYVYSVSRRSLLENAQVSHCTALSIFDYKCNRRIRLKLVEENCIQVNKNNHSNESNNKSKFSP